MKKDICIIVQEVTREIIMDAFHIDAAREVHQLTVNARRPPVKNANIKEKPQTSETLTSSNKNVEENAIEVNTVTTVGSRIKLGACSIPCSCCGQVIIPAPVSSFPIQDTPSIAVDSWFIFTQHKPILNANEIDNFENILNIPVPEMIFGNNKVEILNADKKFHVTFNALDALKQIDINPENLIKVSYANEWFKSRKQKHEGSEEVSLEVHKPFDWTYTSHYKGTMITDNDWVKNDEIEIPLDKLTSNNPIKFFDEMILYEDELADNGISILNIKIRVMSDCLLLLQRLFVRVDDVLVRIIDTRLYIDFDTDRIIRQQKIMQDSYKDVVRKAPSSDPKRYLRDINWCSQALQVCSISAEYIDL
ncbi:hypothetical protein CANINC_000179 [Pichia inconspicua]|uniref:TIP41-like protein n=1 Tax=Pichia inconspicua TaxID=52247 RepID=A0A4T0X6S6_9ASCO|nr:hypothetical protein CANINC_000179 [[Candida] inconspicua]